VLTKPLLTFEKFGGQRLLIIVCLNRYKRKLTAPAKTVLFVDDDKSILRAFTRIFQKKGYCIDVAETGKEAIEKIENNRFDVVLLDVRLPDCDGADLLPKIQKNMPDALKILITGFPSMENGAKALYGGADAYLVKPVIPDELLSIIEDKLTKRENSKRQ